MAMKTLRVRVCDFPGCEHDTDVCRYRIAKLEDDARTITLDLCGEHAAPLEPLLDVKPADRRRRPVTSMNEVRAQKRTPPRKAASSKKRANPKR